MTELELYKIIEEEEPELSWHGDELICWFFIGHGLKELAKKLGHNFFDEGGIECRWQGNYLAIDLCEICNYYDIDPENILKKE